VVKVEVAPDAQLLNLELLRAAALGRAVERVILGMVKVVNVVRVE
jgi:hypothetical protein